MQCFELQRQHGNLNLKRWLFTVETDNASLDDCGYKASSDYVAVKKVYC